MAERRLDEVWRDIESAGGVDAYINSELSRLGFLVERRDAGELSRKELQEYKQSLKQEAARKRELKRETWLAYRAAHITHLGEGVFWNDALDLDRFDLPNADAVRVENELPQLEKPLDLARALKLDVPRLRGLCFHRDVARMTHYRCFTIPKRDGSTRAIWEPLPRLKRVQRWILREILEHLPVHGAAHGFLPGRSIAGNAAMHQGAAVVLRMDIREFFPTVTMRRVRGVFRRAGYREQIATLLAMLCTEAPRSILRKDGEILYVARGPRSLPQGAPTSPALSNIVCMRLDRRLTGLANKHGWRYTRYADDMVFSLPEKSARESTSGNAREKVGTLMGAVRRIVEDEGFSIHAKKTRVAGRGARQQITGLVVNDGSAPRIPRDARRRLRAALNNLEHGKPFKNGENFFTLLGHAAYLRMTDEAAGDEYLRRLRNLIQLREST